MCQHLLPKAAGLTVGELVDEIKRACLAVDPDWAEKKYKNAVRRRRVVGFRNPDGTANLAGYDQPVDWVAAACHRIDTLARACKRAGDARRIDHIRSDLYLGMTDGTFQEMTDAQIIDHVLAHPYVEPDTADADHTGDDGNGGNSGNANGDGRPGGGPPGGGHAGPATGGSGKPSSGGSGSSDPGPGGTDPGRGGRASGPQAAGPGSGDGGHSGQPGEPRQRPAGAARRQQGPGISAGRPWAAPEVRIALATVLGLDERPRLGARPRAARPATRGPDARRAQWRWVACDPDTGHALAGGLLTTRPRTSGTSGGQVRRDAGRGGIIELAAATTDLAGLATHPDEHGGWAGVIRAIVTAYAATTSEDARNGGDNGSSGGDHGDANPHRRLPGARLRRWIQLRDRQCSYPGCRAPATAGDLDHRVDYADGGLTTADNLHPPCRHDHRVKHDGGWTVRPTPDGATTWTSPLGHRYTNRPPPVIPPPPALFPHTRDPDWHPIEGQSWLDEPWQPDCDCVLMPCPHIEAEKNTGNTTGNSEGATTGSEATDTRPNPEPPIFDDEPPF